MYLLFDKHFEKACQLIDQGGVDLYIGRGSDRKVYQVKGNIGSGTYLVIPNSFCSCQSFYFEVVSKLEAVYCKHQLAVLLADALKKTRVTYVSNLVIAEILAGF